MSNLYPHLNPQNNSNQHPRGSFDDYDSIIDEFSIRRTDSDDVSSMHMSEMGGASVANAAAPQRSSGGGAAQFVPASVHASAAAQYGTPPPAPRAMDASASSPQRSASTNNTNSDIQLGSDTDASGYYYHVGDLGIDASDVSAILGVASADPLDEESLLFAAAAAQPYSDLLPSVAAAKNNIGSVNRHSTQASRHTQLGPLGDVLSYATSNPSNNGNSHSHNDHHYGYGADNEYNSIDESEEEGEDNDGLLPNWIAFSSQRAKFILVISTALILGSLVLAIVVLGISYGTTGGMMNSNNNGIGGSDASSVSVDRVAGNGVPPNTGNNDVGVAEGEGIPIVVIPVPTKYPTEYPTTATTLALLIKTSAPVLSTTGEEEEEEEEVTVVSSDSPTSRPTTTSTNTPTLARTTTFLPTSSQTSTNDILDDLSSASDISPTKSPRLEPSESSTPFIPTLSPTVTTKPTASFSASPSFTFSDIPSTTPTVTSLPTISTMPISRPSLHPTSTFLPTSLPSTSPTDRPSLEPSLHPTSIPSTIPTDRPSIVPSSSIQPSWSFGDDAIDEGDASFYLMADGGSNWQFWTEKLEKLVVEDHKFMVHLGSATRAVDDCTATAYYRTQLSLSVTPIPVYSIPGNNDWPECSNPTSGWQYYQQHMMDIDTLHWNATTDYDVKRHVNRTENFSFLYKKVLFVGLHMVTNSDGNETLSRLEDNIDWVVTNVEAYRNNIDAIFVMGYARLLAQENKPFYNAMVTKKQTEWSDKLLVYARRSSESDITKDVGGVKDFLELKVGNEWPIMDVRVKAKKGKGLAKLEYQDVEEVVEEEEEVV